MPCMISHLPVSQLLQFAFSLLPAKHSLQPRVLRFHHLCQGKALAVQLSHGTSLLYVGTRPSGDLVAVSPVAVRRKIGRPPSPLLAQMLW